MRVIVTGATSFIGAVTVRQLLEKGDTVCGIVRPASQALAHLDRSVPEQRRDKLSVLALDMQQIGELGETPDTKGIAHENWDAWIHVGWDGAGSDNRTKEQVQQNNVSYALHAMESAARLGCRRFVFTGSQAEYGVCHDRMTEDTPCHPVSEYGKAKVAVANQGKALCKSLKMEYIHTRIFSVYGPGDHPWSLVNTCLDTWERGGHMELGECTQKWNFLYIEDTVSALLHLLTEGYEGIYNIAGNNTRILRDYIEEMYELCGSRGSYTYGIREPNAEGPASLIPDIGKILTETSWRPHTSFTEGIYETMHCMRKASAR